MPTLQTAIDSLYQIAVISAKRQSTQRLSVLAQTCAEGLARRGLPGVEAEVAIPGGARTKDWDVAWKWAGKYRLVISLKSILENLPGSVPNRLDDVMGENANIQMYSPEIVTGYVMVFNVAEDRPRREGDATWLAKMTERLAHLSGRRAPYWTPGTFESHAVIAVDFSQGPRIVSGADHFEAMLDTLAAEAKRRNPAPEGGTP
jgi:hypothetical protein